MAPSAATGEHPVGSVLFAGQAFYHHWYLSRALRERGWRADVLNWMDPSSDESLYFHGQDFQFHNQRRSDTLRHLKFFLQAIPRYEVFHFANAHSMHFGARLEQRVFDHFGPGAAVRLLKRLGKKIVYTNNGCLDGVSQSSFATWGDAVLCNDCKWQDVPSFCSDARNLEWGKLRNSLADYQCMHLGNRTDYNDAPTVHEVPEVYCMDPNVWDPDLLVPANFRLPIPSSTLKIYHAVGHYSTRTGGTGRNLKSTHIWLPIIDRLKREGHDIETVFFTDVPNKQVRYYQLQADIVVDMLTLGFFGANIREAMMLGKPAICYLRPQWLDNMKKEIPEYVEELPVVSATPDTAYQALRDLIESPERRRELGRRGREFALKWHSADAGARRLEEVYLDLLGRSQDVHVPAR